MQNRTLCENVIKQTLIRPTGLDQYTQRPPLLVILYKLVAIEDTLYLTLYCYDASSKGIEQKLLSSALFQYAHPP